MENYEVSRKTSAFFLLASTYIESTTKRHSIKNFETNSKTSNKEKDSIQIDSIPNVYLRIYFYFFLFNYISF